MSLNRMTLRRSNELGHIYVKPRGVPQGPGNRGSTSVIWQSTTRVALLVAGTTGLAIVLIKAKNPLLLFTVHSNLMLMAYYGWQVIGRGRPSMLAKGAVTLYITTTGLVWHLLGMGNFLLHYVTPLLALLDWLAFDRRERARPTAPLLWLAYPLAYLPLLLSAGSALYSRTRSGYPPVLDPTELGYGVIALQALALALVFVALGYVQLGLRRVVAGPASPPTGGTGKSDGNREGRGEPQ
jgi:hypothetical protein